MLVNTFEQVKKTPKGLGDLQGLLNIHFEDYLVKNTKA
jgi:hypothetical protein